MRRGDFDLVSMLYEDVLDTLSQLIRMAFIPEKGNQFYVADFSAIEARVIAWLAGEAKGHEYGVVKTKYKASEWDYWAQCPYCTNDVEASTEETATAETLTATVSTVTEKKATESAKAYDKSLAGTYVVTGNLNMRNGAGTGKSIMTVLQKGAKVQNYGYYTMLNSVRWYSVQVTIDNVKYTGFCWGTCLGGFFISSKTFA